MYTMPIDGFPVIYADPPWDYRVYSKKGKGRSAEHHYPTMKLEDIMAIPVADVAAKNSTLFIWGTHPNLMDVLKVIDAWDFVYKTCAFLWAKGVRSKFGKVTQSIAVDTNWHKGMGFYTRANTEFVFLCTRKKGKNPKRLSKAVRQLVVAPIGTKHSEKPREVHERIEQLIAGPFLELFGREEYPGWTVLGNDVTGRDIRDDLAILLGEKNAIV